MTAAVDSQKIYANSKRFESSAVESALERAHKYKSQNLKLSKINSIARKISEKAFEDFKNRISTEFSSESYADLIALVLKARTNYFFHSLPEIVKVTILGKDPAPDHD